MFKKRFGLQMYVMLVILTVLISGCANSGGGTTEAGPDAGAKHVVFKLGHALPDGHPVDLASKKFAQLVKERTGGTVEVQVFPAQQLGNEKDMLEGLTLGTVDMGAIVAGPYGYLQPEFEVMSLVYLFSGADGAEKVLTGSIGQELSDKLLKNKGVRILHPFWYYGTREITSNKAIKSPADLKGMKVRVPEVPVQKEGLIAMGAQATPVDFGELYVALKTGVVDAQENPLATIKSLNLDQVQKYLVLTHHIVAEFMLSVNDKKFQTLTPEQQNAMYEAAKEAAKYNNELVRTQEKELVTELQQKGLTVIEPDIVQFRELVKPLHQKYDQKYSGLISRILQAQ